MLTSIAMRSPARASRIAVGVLFFCGGFCFVSRTSWIPHIQQKSQPNEAWLGMAMLSLPVALMVGLPMPGFRQSRARKI